jgi:thioredoxin 2
MAAPEIQALAEEMAGQAIVLKVNTDQFPELGAQFRVQSIPNFVVLANGRTVLQRAGVAPRSEMRRWIEQAAATVQPQV